MSKSDWARQKAEDLSIDFVLKDGSEGGLYLADVIETALREAKAQGMERAAQIVDTYVSHSDIAAEIREESAKESNHG